MDASGLIGSRLQLDENLVIAMVVHVLRGVRVTAFAEIDFAGVQRQPCGATSSVAPSIG
jgi:hypothetical protein